MDQGRRPRQVGFVLLALVACKASEAPPAPPPPPAEASVTENADFKSRRARISAAYLAARALRKQVLEGEHAFPQDPLPALDFTREGNAILASGERIGREPFTEVARFRIVHLADDPVALASWDHEDKAREPRYQPVLAQIARARYVLFVMGESTPAKADYNGRVSEPARFHGVALLYELQDDLDTTKLLAGIPLHAESRTVKVAGGRFRDLDAAMLDVENRARDALWTALRTRSPSVKPLAIAYVQIDD